MKPPAAHVPVIGTFLTEEKPDVLLDASGILRALMRSDARIWAKRTDRSENALTAPNPSDPDAKLEAAKLRYEERRAAKKRAERLASGLRVRRPR